MNYFIQNKKTKYLAPVLRIRVIKRMNEEMDNAIMVCNEAEKSYLQLMTWLEFLNEFLDEPNLSLPFNQDLKIHLQRRTQEILDNIIDKTNLNQFISLVQNTTKNVLDDKYLMERIMNYFRELKGMTINTMGCMISDVLKIESGLMKKQSEPTITKVKPEEVVIPEGCEDSNFRTLFKQCKHFSAIPGEVKEGMKVHCYDCLNTNKNYKIWSLLEKLVSGHDIIHSRQFNTSRRTGRMVLDSKKLLLTSKETVKEVKFKAQVFDTVFGESKRHSLDNMLFDI